MSSEPNTVRIRMTAAHWDITTRQGLLINLRKCTADQQRKCIFEIVKHVRIQRDAA